MIYKFKRLFFLFEDTHIVFSHNGSSKLEYYSLINFGKINDFEFFKERQDIDFSNYYEIFTNVEFNTIVIQKIREFKISLILEDF